MTHILRSTGAWDRFRDEVRAGLRTVELPTDALHAAAWCDCYGLERLEDYRNGGTESDLHMAAMFFEESEGHLRRSIRLVPAA